MGKPGEKDARVGLVACVKTKRPEPSPAKDLYDSPLFREQRRAVESTCDQWYILSARHGLLHPDDMIEPYEETLVGASRRDKRAWAQGVLRQIDAELGDLRGTVVEVHAGKDYYAHGLVAGLEDRGATVELPAEGLSLGQRLAHYAGTRRPRPTPPDDRSPARRQDAQASTVAAPRGKYRPLHDHLAALATSSWAASFAELEDVIGDELPTSARVHRAWWANEASTHSHARAWVAAGWHTQDVQLDSERVTFVRTLGL